MFLSKNDIQLGRGEPIKDTARVLGRMVHGAIIRTFAQRCGGLRGFSGIPTINALTDDEHPCQILADLLTIREKLGGWENRKIAFIGDGFSNMTARGCGRPSALVSSSPSPRRPPASRPRIF
jgi:ornithine carbamoyltransferase